MSRFSIQDQIDCARRELHMRKNFYPRFVAQGKKTPQAAEKEIAIMADIINTLILAQTAHLDKSWNKPAFGAWHPYPAEKPDDTQMYNEMLVLYANPRFVDKPGFENKAPRFVIDLATWTGTDFILPGSKTPLYFMYLPQLPEE